MLMFAKIENEELMTCSVGVGTDTEFYKSIGMTEMDVEQGYDGQWYVLGHAPVKPKEQTETEIQKQLTDAVQTALDAFAQTRGYDGIMSACSYANSTDAQFKLEADYCITLRDETWRMGYAIVADVKAGLRPIPSMEELIAELPVGSAKWPDEVTA